MATQYPIGYPPFGGSASSLDITAVKVVKASQGVCYNVSVTVAGTTTGSVNDTATTGGVAAANEIFSIPNTVGNYQIAFPFFTGLVITPGTGQTVSVSYA